MNEENHWSKIIPYKKLEKIFRVTDSHFYTDFHMSTQLSIEVVLSSDVGMLFQAWYVRRYWASPFNDIISSEGT